MAKNLGRVPQPFEIKVRLAISTEDLLSQMHWLEERVARSGSAATTVVVRGRTIEQIVAQAARLAMTADLVVEGTDDVADAVRGQLSDLARRISAP